MLYLDSTSKTLTVVMDAAPATTQAVVTCYYYDILQQSTAPLQRGASKVTVTNGLTPVTAVTAPTRANVIRNIHTIMINNRDSAVRILTVTLNDGSTNPIQVKQSLNPGYSLVYETNQGWTVLGITSPPFADNLNLLYNFTDPTKQARFDASGITTGQTRVYTLPDASGVLALESGSALVAGRVVYTGSGGLLSADANFLYNGTNVSIAPSGTLGLTSVGVLTINPTAASTMDNVAIGGTTRASAKVTTFDANNTVTINPASANVTISPTGTGTVTINPATAGTIDAMAIGNTTRASIKGTTGDLNSTLNVSGVVTFAAGLVGTPELQFGGDTTSGLYRPALNQIGISIAGVQVGVFTSTGLNNAALGATTRSTVQATTGDFNSTLNVTGATTLSSTLAVTGTSQLTGNVGINAAPASLTSLSIAGPALSTAADGTVAVENTNYSVTKNDANVRTFYGLVIKPTLNTGASNASTTLNQIFVDSTNTAVTGLTTNLLNLNYGGVQKFLVDSSGNTTVAGTLGVTGATTLSSTLGVTGTSTLGVTNTGAFTATTGSFSSTLAVTGHTTFEGVTSTGATGTGNLVYSANQTLTGTLTAAAANFSGNVSINSATLSVVPNAAGAITINASGSTFQPGFVFNAYDDGITRRAGRIDFKQNGVAKWAIIQDYLQNSGGDLTFSLGASGQTVVFTNGGAVAVTKSAAGDTITFTNGGTTPKTGYLYSDSNIVGIFNVAGAGAGRYGVQITSSSVVLDANAGAQTATFNTTGLTLTNNLIVSGTGPHAIGSGTASSNISLWHGGTFAGGPTTAVGLYQDITLTPGVGLNSFGLQILPTINKAASGVHGEFASIQIQPPTIGASAATLANATTLKITGAPSVGTNQRALWVAAGVVQFDESVGIRTVPSYALHLAGAITQDRAFQIAPSVTPGLNSNLFGVVVGGTYVEHSSGTHPVIAALYAGATITNGAASTTTAANIYAETLVAGAGTTTAAGVYTKTPSGATNNYSLYSEGATLIGGALTYGGVTLNNSVTGTGSMVLSADAALTGNPTATTQAVGNNSTRLATTAFVSSFSQMITNSLSGDVLLNNTANFFDGPSVAQGTSGTWFATGTVTIVPVTAGSTFIVKLWDGTTVIASTAVWRGSNNSPLPVSLSGYITSPAGNIRISVKDTFNTTGAIAFNNTGLSKDSTITAFKVAN